MLKRKKIAIPIILGVAIAGYYGIKSLTAKNAATQYLTASVEKGTLTVSVSGTGQASASNQIDIKPKVSADITYVGVSSGQQVKAGDVIARLDSSNASKAVRDAGVSLASAKLALDKLRQPPDSLSVLQSENTLAKAREAEQNTRDALNKAYADGFNNVTSAFLNLPTAMSGLQDILYSNTSGLSSNGAWNIDYYYTQAANYDIKAYGLKLDAQNKFQTARSAYDANFLDYKATDRDSATSAIESIISETYHTTQTLADAVKSANNLIQFYVDKLTTANVKPAAVSSTHLSQLNTYTGQLNSHLSTLLASTSGIAEEKQALVNARRTIEENAASLAELKNGADPLDIQSSELSVKQRQNALSDAQAAFADYTVRAPLEGVIASVDVQKGDAASAATALATLITKQQVVEIALNEVDITKVKPGQKATLTFDAVDGLTITGTVAEVDSIGTATQGVVNYSVKISFDTQDDRIKPGMSVSANIITEAKPDVLLVPSAAVKTQGNSSYVEVLENGQPKQVAVEAGLNNDTSTEIISGLIEGQQVITQTITSNSSAAQSQSSQNSGGSSIIPMGGGGAFRAVGGGR